MVQIGRERDLSALYMGSNYKNFFSLLLQQREVLDREIENIKKHFQVESTARLKIFLTQEDYIDSTLYKEMFQSLKKIVELRKKVNLHNANFKDIFFMGIQNF